MIGTGRFGTGKLGSYTICSNTDASSFVTSLTVDKPDALPPEYATGTLLAGLDSVVTARKIIAIDGPAPLADIGDFLSDVGSRIKRYLDDRKDCSVVNGTVLGITGVDVPCEASMSQTGFRRVYSVAYKTGVTQSSPVLQLYAVNVVLATGGVQKIPPAITDKPPNVTKYLTGDYALTLPGLKHISDLLAANKNNDGGSTKVVVVGGSHSAFSVAWTLLNKLTLPNASTETNTSVPSKPLPYNFLDSSILLLHRSPIQVYYPTAGSADKDNYLYTKKSFSVDGKLNVFTGLRGDAKALYRRIIVGSEKRIKLYQTPDTKGGKAVAKKACDGSTVVVWCGGYESNELIDGITIPTLSGGLKKVKLKYDGLQVDVDTKARVSTDDGRVIQNLYGIGLGWGLKSVDSNDANTNAKAAPTSTSYRMDGYGIYLKRASSCVLGNIYNGNKSKIWGVGNTSWEDRMASVVKKYADSFVPKPPPVVVVPSHRMKNVESPKKSPSRKSTVAPVADVEKLVERLHQAKHAQAEKSGDTSEADAATSTATTTTATTNTNTNTTATTTTKEMSEAEISKSVDRLTLRKEIPATAPADAPSNKRKKSFKSATEEVESINRLASTTRKKSSSNAISEQEPVVIKAGKKKEKKKNATSKLKIEKIDISKSADGDLPGLAASSSSSSSEKSAHSCPSSPPSPVADEVKPTNSSSMDRPSTGGLSHPVLQSQLPKSVWGEKDATPKVEVPKAPSLLPPMFSPVKRPSTEYNHLFQRVGEGNVNPSRAAAPKPAPKSLPANSKTAEGFAVGGNMVGGPKKKVLHPTKISMGSNLFVGGIAGGIEPRKERKTGGDMWGISGGGGSSDPNGYDALTKRRFRMSGGSQGSNSKTMWGGSSGGGSNVARQPLFGSVGAGGRGGGSGFKNHVSRLHAAAATGLGLGGTYDSRKYASK
jgi:hypothetical protein